MKTSVIMDIRTINEMSWANVFETAHKMFDVRAWTIVKKEENRWDVQLENDDQKCVLFFEDCKISVEKMKNFIQMMENEKINHMIIIHKSEVTSGCLKIIRNLRHYLTIELFKFANMQFNLLEHEFVPHHRKCSELEKKAIICKYGEKLPLMLKNDPVAKFCFYNAGDLIEIKRRNGAIVYRIVTPESFSLK